MDDPWNLERFVDAQDPVWETVTAELRRGAKRTHWMWFVFPQVRGLGRSPLAERYAIDGRDEAVAYLAHPTLGGRLREATALVLGVEGRTLTEILGTPDDLKFRSSMTLFAAAAHDPGLYRRALDGLCDGREDARTLAALRKDVHADPV